MRDVSFFGNTFEDFLEWGQDNKQVKKELSVYYRKFAAHQLKEWVNLGLKKTIWKAFGQEEL